MRYILSSLAALACASAIGATAGTLPPETPIVVDGAVKVDAGDIEGYLMRVPEADRVAVRASSERIATVMDNVFLARSLAAKARDAGLDKDEIVQRRLVQAQDVVLADLYLQHLQKAAPAVNLEPRARELYAADKAKYVTPEHVHVQVIVIGIMGRTREAALERARMVRQEAQKEDFLSLAARYSDDPNKVRNGGDLGYNAPNSFSPAVSKRVAAMTKRGEISEPLEAHDGYHIVRFVDRKKPEQATFEQVKDSIIAAEKERLAKKRVEDLVTSLRSSGTVVVHRDKLEALVNPIDDILSKASKAAATDAPKPR